MRLLNELAGNATLLAVRGASATDDEQESDRELILRFFAMAGHMRAYRMPLSNFLNDEADRGIGLDAAALQQRRALFERAIGNVRRRRPCHLSSLSLCLKAGCCVLQRRQVCSRLQGMLREHFRPMPAAQGCSSMKESLRMQVYAVFGEASFRADGANKLEPSLWDTLMTTFSRCAARTCMHRSSASVPCVRRRRQLSSTLPIRPSAITGNDVFGGPV